MAYLKQRYRHLVALPVFVMLLFLLPDFVSAATVNAQISVATDDADQDGLGSDTKLNNSPLNLGQNQYVGLRFVGHGLPDNAFILNASIRFTTESGQTGNSPSTRIVGEDADNAVTFVEVTDDITDRATTSASVVWNIPNWPTGGVSAVPQQTPDLSAVVQEIVDRPGWTTGNPLVIIFEPNGGDAERLAWSFDGSAGDAAVLAIEYTLCPGGVVTSANDSGRGSLRECINYAAENPGSTISFNIPGPGNRSAGGDSWWGIALTSPLPTLTETTVIDGTTQTTNQGNTNSRGPEIEIDGVGAGATTNGLVVGATAGGSTIRGLAVGNFSDNGILLLGGSNVIAGNHIGLSADGNTVNANNSNDVSYQAGVRVESSNNLIGGSSSAERNVISGNLFAGIELFGAGSTSNRVYGNYIGVDATGSLDRGNSQEGIDLEFGSNNTIGGPLAGQRNILSGNGSDGIEIDGGDGNIVQNNYIGTDVTGTVIIPNVRDGIDINENGGDGAANNLIGGTGANEGNLIRGNTLYGVQVRDTPAVDNAILGNRIYGNSLLGIDLNDDGVTPNDAGDPDVGSNDLLNYPVITSALDSVGTINVYFDLDVPAADYRVEFFTNPSGADPSGNGEGEVFASAVTVTHTGSGIESFSHSFPGAPGDAITATVTEEFAGPAFGATSEFSSAVTAVASCPGGVVTTTADSGTGGSLRSCILWANANTGADTLNIPAGVYTLTIAGRDEDGAATGDLDVTDGLTIIGADARTTIIDGGALDRVFDFGFGNAESTLSNLTIRNGNSGGGFDKGGGIDNRNTRLTISDVILTGNSADGDGGGLEAGGSSVTVITNSTISGNTATSRRGGGLFTQGTLSLTNVTFSGNSAAQGGGFNCQGNCTATNITVTANSASTSGDGIEVSGGGTVSLRNSIVANNAAGQECSGSLVSLGNNLSSDGTCSLTGPGDQPNTSPLLGPLQDNGGPTDTHELLAGSPAIDAGDSSVCIAPGNDTDQRGFPRPVGVSCDSGAFEDQIAPLNLIKSAFWTDGTSIPTGATIPSGVEFHFLLYINNPGVARSDVTVRDVLDPAFQYQAGTIRVDNSIVECAAATCTAAEEQAIFAAIDATPALTDAIDGDVASYTGAGTVIDVGDGTAANAQLNINGDAVWAVMFSVKMP